MNLSRAGFTESRATLLARFVEFWCQKNCFGEWHVEQTQRSLRVSFATSTDVVLFLISEEYGYFVPSATTRPHSFGGTALTAPPDLSYVVLPSTDYLL